MKLRLSIFLCSALLISTSLAKTNNPYKVLGVDPSASQREIQKAFHKLSLQYHPDKNKNKGAQEKFAEINNAYDILSDETKRKNYDLYGDEKGNPGFDAGHPGGSNGGYSYFTGGGPRQSQYNFKPGGWQNMGGSGGSSSKSHSFSFGGPSGSNSDQFGFGMDDIFSNIFGGGSKSGGFSSFGGSSRPQSRPGSSPKTIRDVNSKVFKKEITDKGMTWLLYFYTPSSKGSNNYESVIGELGNSLQGALKVGSINCETEASLCKDLGVHVRISPKIFVYSLKDGRKGSLLEYAGDLDAKDLKSFCQDHLPKFSKRVNLNDFDISRAKDKVPKVLLLSTKKDTPVIWRVLSGLYYDRFVFYDTQVDVSDAVVKKLGVDALPAIVGWLSNGEKYILKTGISVKDLKSAIHDIGKLLDDFETKNKKAASSWFNNQATDSAEKQVPVLTGSNFDDLCGENTPVCIIGAFKSSRGKEKLETILTSVSQMTLSRRSSSASPFGSKDSISYALLDVNKQAAFLNALDKPKAGDSFLIAYKPRREKYATYTGEITTEEVEKFVGSVLNGDVQFSKTRQKPLDTLDLGGNNLQGKFPKFVFRLQNLEMLDIRSNNFNGSILLSEIQNLRNLSSLDLSYNSLSFDEYAAPSDSQPLVHYAFSGVGLILTGLGFGIGLGTTTSHSHSHRSSSFVIGKVVFSYGRA
ncbi:hypothetical protein ACFE04_000847 [Oxalis oulophora]